MENLSPNCAASHFLNIKHTDTRRKKPQSQTNEYALSKSTHQISMSETRSVKQRHRFHLPRALLNKSRVPGDRFIVDSARKLSPTVQCNTSKQHTDYSQVSTRIKWTSPQWATGCVIRIQCGKINNEKTNTMAPSTGLRRQWLVILSPWAKISCFLGVENQYVSLYFYSATGKYCFF